MRRRILISLACLLAAPAAAQAQSVVVAAPAAPVWVPQPPPVYVPGMPPHVYLRERIRWHHRNHHVRVVVTPPAVVVAPPVYSAQPAYGYGTPPMIPLPEVPPPIIVPPPPGYYVPPPRPPVPVVVHVQKARPLVTPWKSRIGFGARGTGQVASDGWNNLGVGGEFLYRASPHVVTELAAEYQRASDGELVRTDVPVTFGVRLHIGRPDWVVSPYFVFAVGLDFARQDLKVTDDDAIYLDAQVGGGLELRLGSHFAITADARLDGEERANDPSAAVVATRSVNGKAVHPLDDSLGGQFRLGLALYF